MRTIYREIVGALLWSADERLLMGKRGMNSGGVYPNVWHIPGGGVEVGETQLEAVVREVFEETGVALQPERLRLVDSEGIGTAEKMLRDGERVQCEMKFFIYESQLAASAGEIALQPGSEFEELRWFEKSELTVTPLVPAGPPLLKRLGYMT